MDKIWIKFRGSVESEKQKRSTEILAEKIRIKKDKNNEKGKTRRNKNDEKERKEEVLKKKEKKV